MQPLREVYSLLMPVRDGRIIVPRAAVAEVMGFTKPKNRPDSAPDFVLGYIEWQSQQIPLVSFEAARGQGVPELGRRTRIAVVFGIGGRLKPDVFAIVTQGYPYLVRVNENVLQSEKMEADETLVLARVRMANEKPYIPDLERLETMIVSGLGMEESGEAEEAAANATVDELDTLGVGDEEEFGAGMLEDGNADAADSDDVATDNVETDEPGIDLGEVTAFGTETNYSPELDALSEALEAAESTVGESGTDEDEAGEPVDLEEVTAFGVDTNYSAELGELSDALQDEGGEETPQGSDDDSSDFSGLDLSDLELEIDESSNAPASTEGTDGASEDDDAGEIDLSGLELDSDDDDKEKDS